MSRLEDQGTTRHREAPTGAPGGAAAVSGRGPAGSRAAVVGTAVVAAVVTWAVVGPLLGVRLDARSGGVVQHVGVVSVVVGSLVASLLAWLAVSLVQRWWPARARTVWTALGPVVLLLSVAGPLGGLTTGAVVGLLLLHLVVGAVLVVGLRRSLPGPSGLR